jgi:RNA-directed DNA polymerase
MSEIRTKEDLAVALGASKRELDRVLNRLPQFYRPVRIPKKDGRFRTLLIPQGKLKDLQRQIQRAIIPTRDWAASVHGGVRGRSVRTSASQHVGKDLVVAMDIKDFFPSVAPHRVFKSFLRLGVGTEACGILTKLTTWKAQLPQGAPTSTGLANLALAQADARIAGFCRQHGFSYTRYVDDITVSGSRRLLKFLNLLSRIVEEEGFLLKAEKTEIMLKGMRQMVTKVIVNDRLNLPREKRQQLRAEVLKEGGSSLSKSLKGRLNWLGYLNPDAVDRLGTRLRALREGNDQGRS